MNDARTPDDVIGDLPGWQGASWSALPGGLTNRVWLLEKGARKAVLKIDEETRVPPYNSRLAESEVQSAAAKSGLANEVLFVDHRIYLSEYVEGSIWDPSDLNQEGKIEQLAAALRRLHALPRSGRAFNALGAAKQYVQAIHNPDKELVSLCLGVIRKTRLPNYLCCCHNDLVAENIIATPALRFLDWEFACDNDPMFDLATIVEHHELGEAIAQKLLDTYFDGTGDRWRDKLAEQQRLYLALYWLWFASRPNSSEKAIRRLAERLTTSCS
jgi:thiamine kinase-like enzyme